MSDDLHYFSSSLGRCAVRLPFELDSWIRQWERLRTGMIGQVPSAFSRDEWAYLITFLSPENLRLPFEQSFGQPSGSGRVETLFRPLDRVALWLPNNVSLLGPLTAVLLSLTGCRIKIKVGSRAEDLTSAFIEYATHRLAEGSLRRYLCEDVVLERYPRDDPRNIALAQWARARIVFGSDQAVAAIDALPHPPGSRSFAFSDHQSEAWVESSRLDDASLLTLGKVFAIYGRAGCTSPARVVLVDGTPSQVLEARDRLAALWPRIAARPPAMHVASANLLAFQLARAFGWQPVLTQNHSAVLMAGAVDLPTVPGLMTLPIVPATIQECLRTMPPNVQTVGQALGNPQDPRWLSAVAGSGIKRFVPIGQMHHFGAVWDGFSFWRDLFETVEIGH